jgi:hypothetical protein
MRRKVKVYDALYFRPRMDSQENGTSGDMLSDFPEEAETPKETYAKVKKLHQAWESDLKKSGFLKPAVVIKPKEEKHGKENRN